MFYRLVIESLRRSRRRKLLALLALTTSAAALTVFLALLLAADDRVALELQGLGANLEIRPVPPEETLPVPELGALRRIFWRNNIVAVAPLYPLRPRLVTAAGHSMVAVLVGTWFDRALAPEEPGFRTGLPATRPSLLLTGRWPRDGAPAPAAEVARAEITLAEITLGRRLAERLGVAAGDPLRLELGTARLPATVVGIVTAGGDEDEQAFASLEAAAALGARPERARSVEVFALTTHEPATVRGRDPRQMTAAEYDRWYCTAYPTSIAHQITEALPGGEAHVVRGVAAASAGVVERLRLVFLTLAGLILAGALAAVTTAMSATVSERQLELGLFHALGAERGRVARFFFAEAAALGLIAGTLGGALAVVSAPALVLLVLDQRTATEPLLMLPALMVAVAIALAGTALPVARALRRGGAELLREAAP